MEKLFKKGGQTKHKINKQLSKFKSRSDQGKEAQDDMILYMGDYMADLVSQGLTEQEAFEKASQELKFANDSEQSLDLNERFQQYYETPQITKPLDCFMEDFYF